MGGGDNFSGGFREGARPALGDVTNRPAKRGFSLVFDDPGAKSRDGRGKCRVVDGGGGHAGSAKQVCLGVENSVKEKCTTGHERDDLEKGTSVPSSKDKMARGSSPV
ncbi:hypothetical protein NL676_019762 [Syzygium grande]|nr:hypothetical protein NL676_019762 [Syzygium grande]